MFEDKYDRSSWDEQYAYGVRKGMGSDMRNPALDI